MDAEVIAEFGRSLDRLTVSGGDLHWAALADIGWPDLLDEDVVAAIQVLLPAQGRNRAYTSVLDAIALRGVGLPPDPRQLGVVFPEPTRLTVPAAATVAGQVQVGDELSIRGVLTRPDVDPVPARCVIEVETPDGLLIATATGVAELAAAATPAGLDPDSGWRRVCGSVVVAEIVSKGEDALTRQDCLRDYVRFATAVELAEIGRHVHAMACAHVKTRHQFGRPLGSFQAVKHRLAQAAVHGAAAETTLEVAADALDSGSEPTLAVLVARIQSGIFVTESLAHAQQLFGGMGYSWELPLHRYVRRAMLTSTIGGSTELLNHELGQIALASRQLPRLDVL